MKGLRAFEIFLMGTLMMVAPMKADEMPSAPTPKPTPAVKHYRKIKKTKAVAPKSGSVTKIAPAQSTAASPAVKSKTSLQVWLSRLKKKVARAENKHTRVVAVASVRGAEASDAPPLYWKGKSSEGPVEMPELKEFDAAVDAAVGGDSASAKTKLQSFIAAYPNSPLTGDAKQTLDMLGDNTTP